MILPMTIGSVISDITRSLPPQFGQMVTSRTKTGFNRCAHARGAVGFTVAQIETLAERCLYLPKNKN